MSQRLLPQPTHSVKTRLEKIAFFPYRNPVIRGLIFDLDGTLVDSLPGIAAALNHSLQDLNLPTHPEKAVAGYIGDGVETLVIRALGRELVHRCDEVVAGFQKHYPSDWKTGTFPYPGMIDLLQELHQKKIPMAVLSNKPHLYTVEIVEALFPSQLFAPIRGHEQEFPKKPDPTTALQIVTDWNLSPAEVAYVGDSTVDLATAQAAKLIPLIFSWGYGTPEDFPLLNSIDDLKQAILGPS
ncbi:MAG: phosphoglycolate phosphatase [Akkermansiaceae bacterium]|jgi:phosphoglycolate phosphatase